MYIYIYIYIYIYLKCETNNCNHRDCVLDKDSLYLSTKIVTILMATAGRKQDETSAKILNVE